MYSSEEVDMDKSLGKRAGFLVFVLSAILAANSSAMAQASGSKGPDILGLRVGMSPQEAYDTLKNIDPTHRVTVGQILIPAVLGNKAAVYGMSPESLSTGDEMIAVSITLPPNPQQVWYVHRMLTQKIHTTLDPIIASLRQKYGQESVPISGRPDTVMNWLFDEQGKPADPQTAAATMHNCGNSGLTAISTGNMPPPGQPPPAGVLPEVNAITAPMQVQISPILDPSKNPACQGWVVVQAHASGGIVNGAYSYNLDTTIIAYGIQKRSAVALSNVLNNASAQKDQQILNKAKQESVPKL
jgi:hypothetical protein